MAVNNTKQKEESVIVVVGLNRIRLAKIISLVEADIVLNESNNRGITILGRTGNDPPENGTSSCCIQGDQSKFRLLYCVAAMSSYEAEDGTQVRFMSNFVRHDGAPMRECFDNDAFFRSSLGTTTTVLMVGYEWYYPSEDARHIEAYFKSFGVPVSIQCVDPNPGYSNLEEEMAAFKMLSDEDKARHLSDQTLGPGKMARFILDSARAIRNKMSESSVVEGLVGEHSVERDPELQEEEVGPAISDPQHEEQQLLPEPPDPLLPMYACRLCRTVLVGQNHLAEDHKPNLHSFNKHHHRSPRGATLAAVECQSLFCDESVLGWLSPNGKDVEGRLECPKCSAKLGHWNWAGAQCSCGTWIVPAIQIPVSKVDTMFPASKPATAIVPPTAPSL
jgi:dual specificity phosphatase 12